MTLSNIFFGKKVVQEAYLNNALIYKSKGWQTLPSTCSEVWTKSYETVNKIGAIAKDEDDNIYIGTNNMVYKFDTEGNLKWKCAVGEVTAIVVYPTYIYCSYLTRTVSDAKGFLSKIDTNGNLISSVETNSFLPAATGKYIVDMQKDNDYIFAISDSYIFKLNSSLSVISYTSVPNTANCIATNNGPYVFVGTEKYGTRFSKNDIRNSTDLTVSTSTSSFFTKSIAVDNIGNLYLASYASQDGLLKFDVETCKLITNLTNIYTSTICIDSEDDCYVLYNLKLKKHSSDGTLIWDNVPIPAKSDVHIKMIADSNGNIYVAYIDNNSMLAIKKLINLVKEN